MAQPTTFDQRCAAFDGEAAATVCRYHLKAQFDRAVGGRRAVERRGADDQTLGLVEEQPQAPAAGIGRRRGPQGGVGGVVETLREGR